MDKQQQYIRVFGHFDEDGDGKISPSELQKCVGELGGELSLEEVEAAVGSLHSDGDGLLGLEEFLRFVEGGEEEEKVKDLKEAFKMYADDDIDGSGGGCITPRSLKRMLRTMGESKSTDECRIMISHFDLNGDGVLNFDEFKVMMM